MTVSLSYEFLPGCWAHSTNSKSIVLWRNGWWIPFICGDGILLILTLAKAFSYRDQFNRTIRLLARDSVLYFIPMFASLVWNVVAQSSARPGLLMVPSEWIACISVSRMMLSIRSLTFNEPLTTQRLNFSTLIFENRDHAEGLQDADITEDKPGL